MAQASPMLIPSILEERAASLSRVPPQSGQAPKIAARSTNARIWGRIDSRSLEKNDFFTRGISPS